MLVGLRGQHVFHVLRQLVESHGTVQRLLQRRGTDRNVYGSALEAARLHSLAERLPATLAAFRERIREFLGRATLGDGRGLELHRTAACRRR